MSECLETISDDKIKEYWMSFFPEAKSKDDLEEILSKVSNKNFKDMIETYKNQDTSIVEIMVWSDTEEQKIIEEILNEIKEINFWVNFYEPVFKKYIKKLIDAINASDIVLDKETFLYKCISNICPSLHIAGFEVLIVETYYAKKNNLLKGKDRNARGEYFNEVLLKDNEYRKEVYECYPELIRVLDIKVSNSIDFIIGIIKSTEKEINNIEKAINGSKSLGKIIDISMGEGDTHNNGKTVSKLKFDSGKTIIYKPHKLDMEQRYYEFIEWFNKFAVKNDKCKLMAAKSYSYENQGWMEFIEQKDCETEDEIRSFYHKMGTLLCILYTTNAVDIHNENLISHGSMPVLVDLETFMHGDFVPVSEDDSATVVAIKKLNNSVTKNILLPTYITNKKNKKVFDLGGLSASKEQESPFATKFIKDYGTDEVRVKIQYAMIEAKSNNASIKGKAVDSRNYKEDIIEGFKETYKWILKNKLMYVNILKDLFKDACVRIIFRATNVYTQLLYSSYHPDLITNSVDRYIYLHRISNKNETKYHKINAAEIQDLLRGDIPYFSVKAGEKKIYGSGSEESVYSMEHSILGTVEAKIKDMDEVDLSREVAIINSKLITEPVRQTTVTEFQQCSIRKDKGEKFLKAAEKIADSILERCIIGKAKNGKNRIWFGNQENEFSIYEYRVLDNSLYYGLIGIATFFNYLEKISKNEKYKGITKEICATIVDELPKNVEDFEDDKFKIKDMEIGGFSGLAGVVLSLMYIDNTNGENKYEEAIDVMLDLIEKRLDFDIEIDVIRHVGTLGDMISIYDNTTNNDFKKKALMIAVKVYNRIKDKWVVIEGVPGISWTQKGYVGYAHGNAGIVAQLYRLYKITKDEEIKDLIDKSLIYERAMYVEKEKNWRRAIDETNFSYGWCHGAPGILLSKIQLLKNGYRDEFIDKEIQVAIESIINSGLRRDWCLCHGDMGNLSILKEVAIILKDEKLYNQTVNTIDNFIEYFMNEIDKEEFKEMENNGFMLGLSGVGYELLRINREKEMPNMLALE